MENRPDPNIRIKSVFWLSLAAVTFMSLPNLLDPMVRHDDYPALFAIGDLFWDKTLNEGRWVSYIWHLRGYVTPSWLNFSIYQALWALFAAATASLVIRRRDLTFFKAILALLILVSPSALLLSLWFNTALPGLAMVSVFACLACRVSQRTLHLLLPVFVTLTLMSYTTYPLLLLAICLVRQDQRSIQKLFGLLALFTASFLGAVLLTYAINWQIHDVFGIPLAEWRDATPAHNLQGLHANLPKLWEVARAFMENSSFHFFPAQIFHLVLFFGSAFVLVRNEPMEAFYLYAGLFTGLVVVTAQVLKLGVYVPPRAFIFAWVFYAIAVVRAAEILSTQVVFAGRLARNAIVLIIGSYLLQSFLQATEYRDWQAETRKISQIIAEKPQPILISGHPSKIASARRAGIQSDVGFQFRMLQLSGHLPVLSSSESEGCVGDVPIAAALPTADNFSWRISVDELGTTVIFPASDECPR